ncbi:MAG TPA: DMT family transporter [Thermotogaceae bacterium]|nr:DMT family transporter [Thermotogaceae bacterium]
MKKVAIIWLLFITVIWGSIFPIQKIALFGVSPLVFNSIKFWIAFVVAFFIWKERNFKYAFVLGLLVGTAYISQTIALKLTDASKVGFITSLYVPMVPIFSYTLEREKITKLQFLGFGISLIGFYLITGGINKMNTGDLLTVVCAVSFAMHLVLVTKFSKRVKETSLLSYQFLTVALISTLLSFNSSWHLTSTAIWVVLYTSVVATVLPGLIQLKYQKVVGSNTAALIYTSQPVFALLLSYLLLGERLSLFQTMGAMLLLTAMVIASLKKV